jgi:uncharacterized protein (TIGR02646 family)
MKYIKKDVNREPKSLTEYRETTPNARFNGGNFDKQVLREVLATEQGYLCAYCNRRISTDAAKMEVEHYITQTKHEDSPFSEAAHKDSELRYTNLLATCNYGGHSCSGKRGNTPLSINPCSQTCEILLIFDNNGNATTTNAQVQTDINTLELQNWKEQRKAVIDKARTDLSKIGRYTSSQIDKEIQKWRSTHKNKNNILVHTEFCMAAVHYLERKKRSIKNQ